ncbi:MAG: proline--tRNA ligase [Candidatus Sumerlaeia bacterium]|nr:proline--tRNA ligase [Candidatus Sumerlaeia bacterium]
MAEKEFAQKLTPKSQDFSQWYVETVLRAGLADYTDIKGCMVIRPYGYTLWENMRDALDRRIKATGHENAYFPLFVPESLLKLEAEHVQGFAPECAWVTYAGNDELEERLAIRPTSEAIIGSIYARWIQSYRDLPVLINQWANVVRWEKRTRLFLRTSEFLWQEGHTCHRTYEEAQEETLRMLGVYKDFIETELAIPVVAGQKSESEKFAGAQMTYTVEALMADGLALQAGTSHNLGQHFAKVFGIKFLDEDNVEKYVWQTSWGVSTRLVGGIVMVHGDDNGLILPPRVAPCQTIVIPVITTEHRAAVLEKARALHAALAAAGIRTRADLDESKSPGWKYNEWDLRGVPLRIEIGPKDMAKNQVCIARRDLSDRAQKKAFIPEDRMIETVRRLLDEIQTALFNRARDFRDQNTRTVANYAQFRDIIESQRGFVVGPWAGSADDEAKIKEDTKATLRCIPLEQPASVGPCFFTGRPANRIAYFARAY